MNLIDGAVDAGGTMFRSQGLVIDLARLVAAQDAAALRGKELTLGIRPEHLMPAQAGDAIVEGAVELVEDLGADRLIHVDCGRVSFILRWSGQESFRRGDRLGLTASAGKFHWFHRGARQILAPVS
jgi:ABC-type sugar transport system ATPase subunit